MSHAVAEPEGFVRLSDDLDPRRIQSLFRCSEATFLYTEYMAWLHFIFIPALLGIGIQIGLFIGMRIARNAAAHEVNGQTHAATPVDATHAHAFHHAA